MPRNPEKKLTGLREKCAKRKEEELAVKAMIVIANVEYEYGKYFYEFFYAACNVLLYYRGLHSQRFFAMKDSHLFSFQIPQMRFPETIVYLEKVCQKAVNCFLAGYLDAFMFEERDRYGNTVIFMFRLHGMPIVTPTVVVLKDEIFSELKQNCEKLLLELKRTLTSMRPVAQPNMFRWKVELGLKKVDRLDSKWKNNNQGIFVDDPDWKHFPWLRNTRDKRKSSDSLQDPDSPAIASGLSSSASVSVLEDSADDFFGTNNFQDVELEEDMGGSPVKKDYEKEGFSIIEYNEDLEDGRPGSPDMFADTSEPISDTGTSIVPFHMELATGSKEGPCGGNRSDRRVTQVTQGTSDSFTSEPDKDSSLEDFKDATNIFDEFEDFSDLDTALQMLENEGGADELNLSLVDGNGQSSSEVKFFVIATQKLLDTLICNILAFKDTQADKLHSDYRPAPVRRKGKRLERK